MLFEITNYRLPKKLLNFQESINEIIKKKIPEHCFLCETSAATTNFLLVINLVLARRNPRAPEEKQNVILGSCEQFLPREGRFFRGRLPGRWRKWDAGFLREEGVGAPATESIRIGDGGKCDTENGLW
ncbi:hypothetical protein ACFX15_033566 [Malus domestica]